MRSVEQHSLSGNTAAQTARRGAPRAARWGGQGLVSEKGGGAQAGGRVARGVDMLGGYPPTLRKGPGRSSRARLRQICRPAREYAGRDRGGLIRANRRRD